ncbi:hypothetical protein [Zobellia uliginosa]|uniref:hypothetical protein n=1 Tax=Zobellia uliginosa TaxID=143224 RepID=UPI001C079CE4|nr:hypothetical protein [Zobellia uliginosa]MBU2945295.1 hypothetical protein [Zobellia uliginosa]
MLRILFVIVTLLALIIFYFGIGKNRRVLVTSLVWLLFMGLISYNGYLENTDAKPPRFLFVMVATAFVVMIIYKSVDKSNIKIGFLTAVHTVRVPVELFLFELYLQEQIPALMTFKGWNFDILIGIFSFFILFYLVYNKKNLPRFMMLLWNIIGLLFLATIVFLAVFSAPLPIQQFAFDQPNIAVVQFPYVFLPTLIVPVVFLSHLLSIKKLLYRYPLADAQRK